MTREEAIVAMVRDGKTVIYGGGGNKWSYRDGVFYNGYFVSDTKSMASDGYEIYEEPKKKVKVRQYRIHTPGKNPWITSALYRDSDNARQGTNASKDTSVYPLLYTEIEVDDWR